MTSRRKRNNRLSPEEKPSDVPQGADPADESAPVDPSMLESAADAGEPQGEATPKETEFYFPPLKSDGIGDFTPLPGRSKNREPIQLPGPGTSRRRKRPNRPIITRPDADELGQRFESMAYRAAPTFDFFLFTFLASVILGLGYLFDAPAVLLVGIVVAPVLTPWVGAMLAAVTGEIAFLKQTMGGFLTALFIVFIMALLIGLISRMFGPFAATQLQLHGQLLIFDLLLVAGGSVALTLAFVQSEEKPLLTSLLVAYEIYLPASAAGFGLGSGLDNIWPQALLVLLVHLAISIVAALLVFYYMGFRPLEASGYVVLGLIALGSLAVVIAIFAWGNNPRGGQAFGTPVGPKSTAATLARPTVTSIPTITPTPTQRLFTPTASETSGPTSVPTPIYGHIGKRPAYLQDEPGGTAMTTLDSGYLVEFLPDSPSILEGTTWVRVKVKTTTNRDIVGWVRLDFIVTTIPSADTKAAPATRTPTSTVTMTLTIGPSPTATATYEATGSYSVVNITKFDAALNVRTAAGITNPLAGSLAYTMTDIGKLGPPVMVGTAEWWLVRKTGGVTGWVNSAYLTEYIPSTTFCADAKVKTLLTDLGSAVKNADGSALAALVSPKHGLDIRLVANNNPVNYPKADAAAIFGSNAVQNWGPALGSDAVKVSGTFADVIQPKLLEVYNASYESTCNDTSKIVGPANQTWPSAYSTINFYSLYKPATGEDKDWRDFLVGIEYVDGQPYLFSLVNFQPVP